MKNTEQELQDIAVLRSALAGWQWDTPGVTVTGESIIIATHPQHGRVVGKGRSDGYALTNALQKISNV